MSQYYNKNYQNLIYNLVYDNAEKKIIDIDITRVLEEDTFINEFRSNKEYLLEYLNIEKMDSLLNFLLGNSIENLKSQNKYKYPLIASEFFMSDNNHIYNYLFDTNNFIQKDNSNNETDTINIDDENKCSLEDLNKKENYSNRITRILNYYSKNELCYTTAGYLSNVLSLLMQNRPELIIEVIMRDIEFIKNLLKHSNLTSVSNLILSIINFNKYFTIKNSNDNEKSDEIIKFLESQYLIFIKEMFNIFISTVDNDNEADRNKNLFNLIYENIKFSKLHNKTDLLAFYFDFFNIENLMEIVFNKDNINKINYIKILCLLIEMINIYKIPNEETKDKLNNMFKEKVRSYAFSINEKFIESPKIVNSFGINVNINTKKINSELFLLGKSIFYLKLVDENCDDYLKTVNIGQYIIEVFKNFPLNNYFHNICLKIINEVFLKYNSLPETIKSIIESTELQLFMVSSGKQYIAEGNKTIIAYMNHLKSIYETIIEVSNENNLSYDDANYKLFKEEYYDKEKEKESFCLGGFEITEKAEIIYEFTIYDIKKRFSDFLSITYDQNGEEEYEESNEELSESESHTKDQLLDVGQILSKQGLKDNSILNTNNSPSNIEEKIIETSEHNLQDDYKETSYWNVKINYHDIDKIIKENGLL